MSMIVAPDAVAAVTPALVVRELNPRSDTRPVEPAGTANSERHEDGQTKTVSVSSQAETSSRPPGTDPSLPPQTIFDASLISADFKPNPNPQEVQSSNRDNKSNDGATDEDSDVKTSSATGTSGTKQDSDQQANVQMISAYSRGTGSQLALPSSADPNWLSAIDEIA